MKYIFSTSQMSKLSLTLCTFSIAGSVADLFLTISEFHTINFKLVLLALSYSNLERRVYIMRSDFFSVSSEEQVCSVLRLFFSCNLNYRIKF